MIKMINFLVISCALTCALAAVLTQTRANETGLIRPQTHSETVRPDTTSNRVSTPDLTADAHPAEGLSGQDTQDAWNAFEEVVGRTALGDSNASPTFVGWSTKTDLGLESNSPKIGCDPDSHSSKPALNTADISAVRLNVARTIRESVQLHALQVKELSPMPDNHVDAIAPGHGSAPSTVRFNDAASQYLACLNNAAAIGSQSWFNNLAKQAVSGGSGQPRLSKPTHDITITKTIWQVNLDPKTIPFYWTCQTAETEGVTQASDPGNCLELEPITHGVQLKIVPVWDSSQYKIAFDLKTGFPDNSEDASICLQDKPLDSKGQLPGNCVYHVDIASDMDEAKDALSTNLHEIIGNGCQQTCSLFLVGIHIMKFISDPTNHQPHWLFATFWWTPTTNGQKIGGKPFAGPWGHFTMNATSVGSTNGSAKVVYNPYLEGPYDPNGAISNCIQCHKFAAYKVSVASQSDGGVPELDQSATALYTSQVIGGGTVSPPLGVPDRPQSGSCPNGKARSTDDTCGIIDINTVQTQMIWSMNTRANDLVPVASPPKAVPSTKRTKDQ